MGDQAKHSAAVELFNAVFEQRAVGMALRAVDPHNSRWLRVNQKFCDMLGYTRDELLQLTSIEISVPDERHLAVKYNEQLLRGDLSSYTRDKRYLRKDGTEIWTQIWLSAVLDPDGNPAQIISVIQDISERKLIEDKLRESEELFSRIFNASPILFAISRPEDGAHFDVNNAWMETTGYSHDEAMAHSAVELGIWADEKQREKFVACLEKEGSIREFEAKLRTKDGRELDVLVAGEYMDFRGEPRLLVVHHDITEHKQAEAQLRQAQKMEAVGRLTGGVAHDFNNLMASMLINAGLLEDSVGEDEEAKQSIEAIKMAISRGASLTSRLLAFSRKTMLLPVTADVTGLIGSIEDMLRRTLGETIDLRVEETPGLWPVTIDPHQFEIALVNLVLNARDAMPQGGTLSIETANVTLDETYATQHEEVTPGDYVVFAVSDSGSGIQPEVLEKVFEPFFTTKDVGKGSGLGLSMVYGFAKQSKGHITIYSEIGHGTTVKLYMPRSEEDAAKEGAKDDIQEFARASERILFVEDDESLRVATVRTLRNQGYEVVEAEDVKEAIKHLKNSQPFDLLFTDVVLPGGMNGVEIAEQAKRIKPNIKVIFTTGYAENAVVHNGQLDPDAILINKPYSRAVLLEKIRAILDSESD